MEKNFVLNGNKLFNELNNNKMKKEKNMKK